MVKKLVVTSLLLLMSSAPLLAGRPARLARISVKALGFSLALTSAGLGACTLWENRACVKDRLNTTLARVQTIMSEAYQNAQNKINRSGISQAAGRIAQAVRNKCSYVACKFNEHRPNMVFCSCLSVEQVEHMSVQDLVKEPVVVLLKTFERYSNNELVRAKLLQALAELNQKDRTDICNKCCSSCGF